MNKEKIQLLKKEGIYIAYSKEVNKKLKQEVTDLHSSKKVKMRQQLLTKTIFLTPITTPELKNIGDKKKFILYK